MTEFKNSVGPVVGLRERKRRDTLRRITDAGLLLFSTNGYEATTLDAIAAAAGISRRTFFHYFKSKDDILLSLQTGLGERLVEALADRQPDESPFEALRGAMHRLVAPYKPDELMALDRLMRSSEAVQNRKQANYARDEALLFAGLRDLWPEENEMPLRLLAMLCIGMSRLSLDAWTREGGTRPLAAVLDETFNAMAVIARQAA